MKQYLKRRIKPDIVYCAVPPIASAFVAASFCRTFEVPFVIDLQDLWPESFSIALGNTKLSGVLLYPMKFLVNRVYKQADGIIAVSKTYVNRAKMNNNKATQICSIYLGTDGRVVNEILKTIDIKKADEEFWVGYIGNLGQSYDFIHVFQALDILRNQGIENIRFVIVGDGDRRDEIQDMAKKHFTNTLITGYLPYSEMFGYVKGFDIALNPIIAGASNSVVNKVGDYAAAGIPVVNTQDNEEYRSLLADYNAGVSTNPEDSEDIAKKILLLYSRHDLVVEMGRNNRRLFEEHFDRNVTYGRIVDCIKHFDATASVCK